MVLALPPAEDFMHEPTPNTIRNAHARLRPSPQAENASARRLSGMELTLGSPPASQYLDIFNREMKPRSANWAIWWSDLMMTMFIMFAALYAFQMPVSRAVPSPSEPMPVVVRPRPDDAGSILARIHDQIRDVIQRESLGDSVIARLTPGKSLRVTLAGDAFFISGSATLRPEGKNALAPLARILRGAPHSLAVSGHASAGESLPDGSGPWTLSTARSGEVAKFLIRDGVSSDRVSLAGYGDQRPLRKDMAASARNRRVDLVLSMDNPTEPVPEIAQSGSGFRSWVAEKESAGSR